MLPSGGVGVDVEGFWRAAVFGKWAEQWLDSFDRVSAQGFTASNVFPIFLRASLETFASV